MRILHVDKFLKLTSARAGGVGAYIDRLSRLQRQRGHEVNHFGCADTPGKTMPVFYDFAANPRASALPRMIHNSAAAAAMEKFLRRHPVDIAHLHNIYHHLTPSIIPPLARRDIGIVMTIHDYRLACPTKHFLRPNGVCTRCLPNKFYHAASPACAGLAGAGVALETLIQRFWRRYISAVDYFICPGRYMSEVLRRTGVPAAKTVFVPNIVNAPACSANPPADSRLLLFAGRLSDEKGPLLMLELASRLPDAQVVIAGDGPLMDELRGRANQQSLGNIEITGQLPREELSRLFEKAAAVVLTSRCPENSPQTMLEAMAADRCVIAPDHAPIRQWIRDGETGRLFSPDDGRSLAEVAGRVLADAASRRKMAHRGRELVQNEHKADKILSRLEELYRESVSRCALRC